MTVYHLWLYVAAVELVHLLNMAEYFAAERGDDMNAIDFCNAKLLKLLRLNTIWKISLSRFGYSVGSNYCGDNVCFQVFHAERTDDRLIQEKCFLWSKMFKYLQFRFPVYTLYVFLISLHLKKIF